MIEDLLETLKIVSIIKVLFPIVLFILFCILVKEASKIRDLLEDIYNNQIDEEKKQDVMIEQLERIAQALESNEEEPYIIEKEEDENEQLL